jgi:hypothetical protein
MGGWDEICLICGLSPNGGPKLLFYDLEECLSMLIEYIQGSHHEFENKELREEIRDLLLLFHHPSYREQIPYANMKKSSPISLPYFPLDKENQPAIVVGTFGEDGDSILMEKDDITTPQRGYVCTLTRPFTT